MKIGPSIASILCSFVLLSSCSGQTKQIPNENELSILLLNDTIAYYNGILDKNIKVTTIPFDTVAIKELVKKNKKKYDDRLRIFIKLSNETRIGENAMKLIEIANEQEVFATAFPLTKTDKSYFKVEDFSWEPPAAVEIVEPTSVTTRSLTKFPALMVELRKDNSVWYSIMTNENDIVSKKVDQPMKENLKKIIAGYNEMIAKENKTGVYYIKGDNSTRYPEFKGVLEAFKENNVYKFQMITTDEDYKPVPEEPGTLNLFMPKDTDKPEEQNKAKEPGALTILLSKENHIYYYEGQLKEDASNFKQATFGSTAIVRPGSDSVLPIRKVIIRKKKEVIDAHIHDAGCGKIQQKAKASGDKNWQNACLDKDLVVVIKPGDQSPYKNTVAILDEMTICDIKRYAMVDPFPVEVELIKKVQ